MLLKQSLRRRVFNSGRDANDFKQLRPRAQTRASGGMIRG